MSNDLSTMSHIERSKAAEFIEHLGGTIFTATFRKKDGTMRKMVCRRHVTKGVKGTGTNYAEQFDKPYITVYDMQKRDFRNVNLDTLISIKTHGIVLPVG